jgi:ParB-like chromosome segregation protein Spo0J
MTTIAEAASRLALTSASVAAYCDRAEHLEPTDREAIRAAGAELRALAFELAADRQVDLVQAYRRRLESVERRHPLYPAGGFAAVGEIPGQGASWRQLQRAQWEHDRHYHPDVLGLSRYEQLRHYAFHLAKLAGAAAEAANGDDSDFFARRLPDLLLFGLKLSTLTNEQLPDSEAA